MVSKNNYLLYVEHDYSYEILRPLKKQLKKGNNLIR